MQQRSFHIMALIIMGVFFLTGPVSATLKDIPAGGTVYIGEQGIDISAPAGAGSVVLGWWASGAAITTTSPDYQISVPDTTNFYVSPSEFGSRTGVWYNVTTKTSTINVADPRLSVAVEDTTVSVDVTDKWVPTDDQLRFRIESNLLPISQRTGVTSVPITIVVKDPNGGTFTSLINSAGTTTSIVDIPVTTTPFYTDSIWDTGQRSTYTPGTYTIWAECNVNSMKDNYDQAGKTVSQKVSLLNQDHNPLIKGSYTASTTAVETTSAATVTKTPTPTTLTTSPTTKPPITVVTTEGPSAQTATPTQTKKSPGFEGILAALGVFIAIMMIYRRSA